MQHQDHRGYGGNDDSLPGLEGHLRNLILTNAPPGPHHHHHGQPVGEHVGHRLPPGFEQSSAQSRNAESGFANDPRVPIPDDPNAASPRGGRRRLNQAQRRQMSSQLSISIDPNASQYQQTESQVPHHQQERYHQSQPSYQRHQHHAWHPSGGNSSWRGHNQSDSRDSYNGPYGQSPRNHGFHRPQAQAHHDQQFSSPGHYSHRGGRGNNSYQGRYQRHGFTQEEAMAQASLLERLCFEAVSNSEIERPEIAEKEAFRRRVEAICREVITQYELEQGPEPDFHPATVELQCFGSLASGFATKASDMDLGLISPFSKLQPDDAASPIPRRLEKALLDAGFGARLLSRTRVPIIKLCETPPEALLQNLRAERAKWDKGIVEEADEPDEEADEEPALDEQPGTEVQDSDARPASSATDDTPSPENYFEIPGEDGKMHRYHLRQLSKHTLQAYYGLAKRVLRKAGGRDATLSNYKEFSALDWEILTGVSVAFAHGLADTKLKQSVLDAMALNPDLRFKSLFSVLSLIEGQQIVELVKASKIRMLLGAEGSPLERTFNTWLDLRPRGSSPSDCMTYAKDLQVILERLKKLSAVQLLMLEQASNESPLQYYNRAAGFLRGSDANQIMDIDELSSEAVTRYISGIYHDHVRTELSDAYATSGSNLALEAIGHQHMALQLALEFERALESKAYDKASVPDIERYIGLLRSCISSSADSKTIIPTSEDQILLIRRIKLLPDPHKLALNHHKEKYHDALEFPSVGAGTQSDINFAAHLALQNTLLLRCYSHSDPRVRPMVLFIKHWAKARGINSGYRGTLSSYGYVLMVLHYLVNVAQPFVCPNLQQVAPPGSGPGAPNFPEAIMLKGYKVHFWRNENEILHLAMNRQLNGNGESIGQLLRGFFEYYAQSGLMSTVTGKGFDWGRDVLSLRSMGGLLSKQEKGWTGAKTVYQTQETHEGPASQNAPSQPQDASAGAATPTPKAAEVKEVRLRYLFAIEDPFELDHNVARTVTHNGIVSIRDEFRRAWRIIQAAGQGLAHDDLLQNVNEMENTVNQFEQLIDEIHGLNRT